MEKPSPGGSVLAKIASPFVDGIKRVAMDFGILTDKASPEDEIVRYEGTLRLPTAMDEQHQAGVGRDEAEAVTS